LPASALSFSFWSADSFGDSFPLILVDSFDGLQTLFSFCVDIFVDGQPPCSSIRAGLLSLPASGLF
jgi:hypothetical protein